MFTSGILIMFSWSGSSVLRVQHFVCFVVVCSMQHENHNLTHSLFWCFGCVISGPSEITGALGT